MQVDGKCCDCGSISKDMSDVKFESKPFPVILTKIIENIVKKEEYIKYDVDQRSISTDGGNYLGQLYEVNIKGETRDGMKENNIFAKHILPENGKNNIISVEEAYFKESFTYKELSKIFDELQNQANIPTDDRFTMPKSYNDTSTEVIVLDNLAKKGYKTLYRMDVMPLKFAELAVKQIARFHGLFYVIQNKRPVYFDKNLKRFKSHFHFNDDWKTFMQNLCNLSIEGLNDNSKKVIEKFMPKFFEKYLEFHTVTSLPGYTICHGDYRHCNILAKELNGEISDVIPVDYQLLSYGCPLNDFMYLIINGSDQNFRKNHLTNLKNLYYESLEKFLNYFNLKANDIYPRKEFERQFTERLELGLIYALYCTPFHFTREDQVPDIGSDDMTKLHFALDDKYRERIQGIVDDYIEWGYL